MKNLLNFINFGFFKRFFIVLFLFAVFVFISAASYANAVSDDLADSVFRLHVIANSDSKEDQDLKYKVRDNLLKYMNEICANCVTKQEAIDLVNKNKNKFGQIAEDTIKEEGYSYNVNIKIGNFQFPTKNYGDISLPAGYYDALRVEIGEAKGQNWWCVMFPPLCFVDITSGVVPEESKEQMENNLSEEEFALVSDKSDLQIQFKFKLLEFLGNSGLITAKK